MLAEDFLPKLLFDVLRPLFDWFRSLTNNKPLVFLFYEVLTYLLLNLDSVLMFLYILASSISRDYYFLADYWVVVYTRLFLGVLLDTNCLARKLF